MIKNKVIFNGIEQNRGKKEKKSFINVSFIGRLEIENDPKLFNNLSIIIVDKIDDIVPHAIIM